MAPHISASGKAALDQLLDNIVAEGKGIPALFFGVTNEDEVVYFNAKGDKVYGEPDKGQVDDKTTLQLFSMTKFITSIACIQLWEQGKISFDDEATLAKYVPELLEQQILTGFDDAGKPTYTKRTKPLTLRHLLTHTSGLSYPFLNPNVARWHEVNKHPSFLSKNAPDSVFVEPLHFEPGTKYAYSIGIDWAGLVVERCSGQKLQEYFEEHIFKPCGVSQMSFYPTKDIKDNLMQICGRGPGTGSDRPIVQIPGWRNVNELEPKDIGVNAGGAGLLGTPKEYMAVLRGVMKSKDGKGILSPKGYALVFENALPPRDEEGKSHTCYKDLGTMHGILGNTLPDVLNGQTVAHSLAANLHEADSPFGRNKGSVNWGGIAKTIWWIDPVAGIATFAGTQVMDQEDQSDYVRVWAMFEKAVYDGLDK